MANLLDYLATEFAAFDEKPFNPVDSAALSQLCMVCGKGIVAAWEEQPGRITAKRGIGAIAERVLPRRQAGAHFTDLLKAENYASMFTGLDPKNAKDNLLALAASPRFRTMTAHDYASIFDEQREIQFSAMTFVQEREFAYVGFRGTDSSIVGWKEDFMMAYDSPVPAQEQALRYLESVARHTPKKLIVGGHSKGGNLAEYAALKASPQVQQRIERVYVHDGPGFKAGTFTKADYAPILSRLHKTVPQDSVIGLLLESHAPLRVVHSTEKGIGQHSIFSWDVEGDDFVYEKRLTGNARAASDIMHEWLARYDNEERKQLVSAIFHAIEASGAQDALDLLSGGPRTATLLIEAARNTNGTDRDTLLSAATAFAETAAAHLGKSVSSHLGKTVAAT